MMLTYMLTKHLEFQDLVLFERLPAQEGGGLESLIGDVL